MAANEVTISQGQFTRVPGSNLLRRCVAPDIFKKKPQMATLLQIIQGRKRVVEDARLFEWLEQDLDPRWVAVGANTSGTTYSLTDASAAQLFPGMQLRRDLSLTYIITAMVYTAGSATMTLNSSTGLTVGDNLQIGAAVKQELSAEPTAVTRLPQFVNNQVFTARDAWGQSAWVETEDYYGGKTRQWHARDDAMLQHKISLDVEAWNGKQPATQQTLSGNNIQWTNGVLAQIQTNIATLDNGILTWEKLTTIAQGYDRLMESPEPYMFISRAISPILDIVAYQKTSPNNFQAVGSEFGVSVKYLVLGQKRYKVVEVDHWAYNLGQHVVCIDPKYLTLRTCKDAQTKQLRWMLEDMRDRGITGIDGTTGCLTTDMGVKLENEQGAFIIGNIQSGG